MSQITYMNKNFRPISGIEEDGSVWTSPPHPTLQEKLAERTEFNNRVDQLMESFNVSTKAPN